MKLEETVYGFVAERQSYSDMWLVTPATRESDGSIRAHDLSGFMGSWSVKGDYKFFASETGEIICKIAMGKAQDYCNEKIGKSIEGII